METQIAKISICQKLFSAKTLKLVPAINSNLKVLQVMDRERFERF